MILLTKLLLEKPQWLKASCFKSKFFKEIRKKKEDKRMGKSLTLKKQGILTKLRLDLENSELTMLAEKAGPAC